MSSTQRTFERLVARGWAVVVAAAMSGAARAQGGTVPQPQPSPAAAAVAATAAAQPAAARAIDFNRDIRPILSAHCFTCHGPDQATRKSGLRLDGPDWAFGPAKSGRRAIVPGDPAASEALRRLTTSDEDDRMPPRKTGKQLSSDQVERLRLWIAQGAPWRKHWAYERPERPTLPEVQRAEWPRNEIDYFVLARLEAEGLGPAPEASKETLIRRLSLDLTGLAPSVADVDAFLADAGPGAYERLVDRLLGSAHYGERWARPWLDQARYADTNGYEADNRRSIWAYRDWVIEALNRDLPFDRFTIEQFAGDMLPDATREQRVATGFHRNTMVNTEGGTDDEEFRVAAIVDRVSTTFTVWMGTTIGCAQCHSHKYDPISQEDFYRVFAALNQTKDRGRSNDPVLSLPTPEQKARTDEIQGRIAPLQKSLDTSTPEVDAAQAEWSGRLQERLAGIEQSWQSIDPERLEAADGIELTRLDDRSVRSRGASPDTGMYTIAGRLPGTEFTALRLEALVDDQGSVQAPGRHEEGDFVLTEIEFELEPPPRAGTNRFDFAYADFSMDRYGVANAIDGKPKTGWAVAAFERTNRVNRAATFVLREPVVAAPGTVVRVRLKQESDRSQHLLARVRLSASTVPVEVHQEWSRVPESIRALLARPAAELTEAQQKDLARHYRGIHPPFDKVRTDLDALKKQLPKDIPSTLVMELAETNRPTHVLIRGNHLNPGPPVAAGVPEAFHSWPTNRAMTRLELARWLVSPDNPLVGRVTMNRIWAQYFGRGLVDTSEDFGAQGELPTHPELLDWLADALVRQQGWSLKAMHRLIVTSAAYRQSSSAPPEVVARDPFNRLLSRGPRFRMEAEMLRDAALAASGLLDRRIGGPSVFPHQPEGVWNNPYSSDRWELSRHGDQFRRGLYTFWRRTAPYAAFMAFDAPSREVVCERRLRSNTPVQALVTLNDPAFVAAAAGLARRAQVEGGRSARERVVYAFRSVLARTPNAEELQSLLELYRRGLEACAEEPGRLEQFAGWGSGSTTARAADPELTALSVVANALLNLDEALTKG
jgi:mono/diheme cytochrome c family protein